MPIMTCNDYTTYLTRLLWGTDELCKETVKGTRHSKHLLLFTLTLQLQHWKRPWCWERLRAGEGGDRGWDGWMASPTQWTWVGANSGRQGMTEEPGMMQSMGSQREMTQQLKNNNNIILNGEKLDATLPPTGTRQGYPSHPFSTLYWRS